MSHIAVYYITKYGRGAYVTSGSEAEAALDKLPRAHKAKDGVGLVGYVGCDSFDDAINRAMTYNATGEASMR